MQSIFMGCYIRVETQTLVCRLATTLSPANFHGAESDRARDIYRPPEVLHVISRNNTRAFQGTVSSLDRHAMRQQFRPASFAQYRARSTRSRSSSTDSNPWLEIAPALIVTEAGPREVEMGNRPMAARICSALSSDWSRLQLLSTMRNSSPPYRPTKS